MKGDLTPKAACSSASRGKAVTVLPQSVPHPITHPVHDILMHQAQLILRGFPLARVVLGTGWYPFPVLLPLVPIHPYPLVPTPTPSHKQLR